MARSMYSINNKGRSSIEIQRNSGSTKTKIVSEVSFLPAGPLNKLAIRKAQNKFGHSLAYLMGMSQIQKFNPIY